MKSVHKYKVFKRFIIKVNKFLPLITDTVGTDYVSSTVASFVFTFTICYTALRNRQVNCCVRMFYPET